MIATAEPDGRDIVPPAEAKPCAGPAAAVAAHSVVVAIAVAT